MPNTSRVAVLGTDCPAFKRAHLRAAALALTCVEFEPLWHIDIDSDLARLEREHPEPAL